MFYYLWDINVDILYKRHDSAELDSLGDYANAFHLLFFLIKIINIEKYKNKLFSTTLNKGAYCGLLEIICI